MNHNKEETNEERRRADELPVPLPLVFPLDG